MYMRIRPWLLPIVIVACRAPDACAAQRATVELPALAREELAALRLTEPVFQATRDDYADLRVTGSDGAAVPFVLHDVVDSREATRRIGCGVRQPRAHETDANTLELVYELEPETGWPSGLTLDTPLRDFHRRVRVDVSEDGLAWQILTNGASVYGLARFIDVRHTEVAWQPRRGNWLRVTLLDAQTDRPSDTREVLAMDTTTASGSTVRQTVTRESFRVDRIHFWREERYTQARVPVLTSYPLTRVAVFSRRNAMVFVFRGDRAPLQRITFATPSRLFSRSCRLYGRNEGAGWTEDQPGRLLASGTLTDVRFQDLTRTAMTLTFPVSRFREYVLVCAAPDGESAEVTEALGEGPMPRVVFIAAPGRAFTLSFGDPEATAAAMPEAREIRALLEGGCIPIEARLGPVTGTAPGGARRAWLNSSGMMIGAMALAGLVLAGVLLRAARKLG